MSITHEQSVAIYHGLRRLSSVELMSIAHAHARPQTPIDWLRASEAGLILLRRARGDIIGDPGGQKERDDRE